MNLIKKILTKLKNQPDIWFFYGFLLTFTLSIRKIISYSPIKDTFNEYSAIFIYLSDIFLLLTLFFWLLSILYNNSITLSRYRLWITSVFDNLYTLLPPHQNYNKNLFQAKINTKQYNLLFWCGGLPLFFVFLSFLSLLWSQNLSIALFRSIKLLEFYFLYLYIIFRLVPSASPADKQSSPSKGEKVSNCSTPALRTQNVPRGTIEVNGASVEQSIPSSSHFQEEELKERLKIVPRLSHEPKMFHVEHFDVYWNGTFSSLKTFFSIIIFLGLFQSIIGIIQFFSQNSIGLFWLWESQISPEILGVAKLVLDGEKYIRAYGLMPHPNILGGFLLFSIIITLLYQKLFHACPTENCSTPACPVGRWNNFGWVKQFKPSTPSPLQACLSGRQREGDQRSDKIRNVPRPPAGEADGTISEKKEISFSQSEKSNLLFEFKTFTFLKNWIFRMFHVEQFIASPSPASRCEALRADQPSPCKKEGVNCSMPTIQTQNVPRLPREFKLFHVEQFGFLRGGTILTKFRSRLNLKCSTWNNLHQTPLLLYKEKVAEGRMRYKNWLKIFLEKFNTHKKGLFTAIIFIQVIALFLTFSKSALIGLFLALIYICIHISHKSQLFHACPTENCSTPACPVGRWNNFGRAEQFTTSTPSLLQEESNQRSDEVKIVPRPPAGEAGGTICSSTEWNILELIKQFKKVILIFLILVFSFFIFAKPDLNSIFIKSLNERILYLNVPRETLITSPIFGIGAGQGVISMQKFFQKNLEPWEYQPIHNVFLIILTELGIVGLILFIWWLWKLFHPPHRRTSAEQFQNVPRGTFQTSSQPSLYKGERVEDKYILEHNNTALSNIVLIYFKGILIGFIFIMLFDHYLWDIQQGSLLFWLTAGFIAGIKTMRHKKST